MAIPSYYFDDLGRKVVKAVPDKEESLADVKIHRDYWENCYREVSKENERISKLLNEAKKKLAVTLKPESIISLVKDLYSSQGKSPPEIVDYPYEGGILHQNKWWDMVSNYIWVLIRTQDSDAA